MKSKKKTINSPGQFETLRNEYSQLWQRFQEAAEAQNLRADAEPNTGIVLSRSDAGVEAHALLLLSAWPYKAATTSGKKLDIAVQVREVFTPGLEHITKSVTQIGYFAPNANSNVRAVRPLLELHYDYESPVQEAHPAFHAQLGKSDWPEEKLIRLGLSGRIDRSQSAEYYSSARIPTPRMGYAPTLVALAADHMKPKQFRTVVEGVRQFCQTEILPVCDYLSDTVIVGKVPNAHEWYDLRYRVFEKQVGRKKFKAKIRGDETTIFGETRDNCRKQVADRLNVQQSAIVFEERDLF